MAVSSTSFKEGNKASVGNKGGRPCYYTCDEMIEKLIEFSFKDDAITMGQFSAEYNISSDCVYAMIDREPEFAHTYDICKNRIGVRREKLLHSNAFHQASYNKNQHFFDTHIRKETRADKKEDTQHAVEVRQALEANQDQTFNFKVNFGGNSQQVLPETLPTQGT